MINLENIGLYTRLIGISIKLSVREYGARGIYNLGIQDHYNRLGLLPKYIISVGYEKNNENISVGE